MKINTNKSGTSVGRWVKKSLCAGIVMGLAMSANMSFAGEKAKKDNGKIVTPFARIAKLPVVKDEFGVINRKATYDMARTVAMDIARYVATEKDNKPVEEGGTGFPADWIVGGMEGGATLDSAVLKIPSPFPVDPSNSDYGIKKANVMDLCNGYYAKQALGVASIKGTTKKVVNGYSHAPALPCELATWNDDENIYIDMLDPNAIFSIFFTDVLVSEDMQNDPAFAEAIAALPVAVKSEIKTVVYKALDAAGHKYNIKDKPIGPKYKTVEDIFEVVAASPNQSPYKHVAYTKEDGGTFDYLDSKLVAQTIINTMSIHGTTVDGRKPGEHVDELENELSEGSLWRSARHEPLGLPGIADDDMRAKNWVIEACSPFYAKKALSTGLHHATALPCEIAVQIIDNDDSPGAETLVISYLDAHFMFGAMFSDMTAEEMAKFAEIPTDVMDDLEAIVEFSLENDLGIALNAAGQIKYNMLPK